MITLLIDIGLAVLLFWLYRPVLHAPFVFDDLTILRNLNFLRLVDPMTASSVPSFFRRWYLFIARYFNGLHTGGLVAFVQTRPITRLSYELNIMTGGINPYHWHVVSIGTGTALVVVFHHVLLEFVSQPLAALGAILLAVHPLMTMSVAYIAGRSSLLAATFSLLAVLLLLTVGWIPALLAAGLAVLSKEEGVAAFVLMGGVAWMKL